MDERNNMAKKVGVLGIIGNIFLFIIKIVIGCMCNSKAMIADSFNSAGDIFASLMTWIGGRISIIPNDEDHNYGHGKAEYIYSLLIGISMIIIAIKMLYDSVLSIIKGNTLVFSWNLVIVSIVTIGTKIALFLYTKYAYKKSGNLLIKSNMIDHRNDVLITFCTLIAVIFAKYNIYFVDGIVGIGISIWIFIAGVKIYRESYNVLMDQAIDNGTKQMIINIIKNNKAVKMIGGFYSIPIGYKYIIVVTIYVNGKMQTMKSHKVADKIEEEILEKVEKVENVIVHIEPFKEKK